DSYSNTEADEALEHLARALQLDPSRQLHRDAEVDPDLAALRQSRPKAFAALCTQGQRST
ncbi:MAG: hypothetical protein CVV27_13380, partial [Candidatus Melainabacteria bacterium HGW-Melainabacteria-1]